MKAPHEIKSLGRSNIVVFVYDENGDEIVAMEWMQYWTGMGIQEVIERLFPWANAQVDQDFYDSHSEFETILEHERERAADIDNGIEPRANNSIADWYPYTDSGETETYRLELKLNALGTAYLTVTNYLGEP